MKLRLSLLSLSLALFASYPALAQAPSGAPAGATGQCKDGSYTNASSKSGACRGHKGVQTWYAASATNTASKPAPGTAAPTSATTTTRATPGSAPAPKPVPTPPIKPPATTTAVPGGGPGLVWVNAETKVYHCQGDRYYGTTKNGKYMNEGDAQKMGAHPARGKTCSAR